MSSWGRSSMPCPYCQCRRELQAEWQRNGAWVGAQRVPGSTGQQGGLLLLVPTPGHPEAWEAVLGELIAHLPSLPWRCIWFHCLLSSWKRAVWSYPVRQTHSCGSRTCSLFLAWYKSSQIFWKIIVTFCKFRGKKKNSLTKKKREKY